ncbi:MAG: CbiX/SirB N-terminal domain-containing protein [Desulfobacterales bacterium]
MKALLIMAHGSRKRTPNAEVLELAKSFEEMPENEFDMVSGAFIRFASPLFEDQVDKLAAKGATQIVVFPYFIAAGSHVSLDIPKLIETAKAKHPGIDFRLIPPIGRLKGIKKFLVTEISAYLQA